MGGRSRRHVVTASSPVAHLGRDPGLFGYRQCTAAFLHSITPFGSLLGELRNQALQPTFDSTIRIFEGHCVGHHGLLSGRFVGAVCSHRDGFGRS
jgi:hypothetical protein